MPAVTNTGSCSPRRKPASTGMTTAHTEVVGATTPIVPMASARYSSPTPKPPARPLAAPHAKSACCGDAGPSSGSTGSRLRSPASCETVTTLNIGARREAKPPVKSAAP